MLVCIESKATSRGRQTPELGFYSAGTASRIRKQKHVAVTATSSEWQVLDGSTGYTDEASR